MRSSLKPVALSMCMILLPLASAFAGPSFLNYPSGPVYNGRHAKPDLSLPEHKAFRTRIREGANEPANFVGEWNITVWGCGTDCGNGVAINIRTGQVITLPGAYTYNVDLGDKDVFEMSLYSRLLIVNGRLTDQGPAARYYFALTSSGFEQIGMDPIATLPDKIEQKSYDTSPESGRELPIYPVDKGCSYFGSLRMGPEAAKNVCVDQEQNAYDTLKEIWGNVPNQVKIMCINRVESSIGNMAYASQMTFPYVGLFNCIGAEAVKYDLQQPRSFKP